MTWAKHLTRIVFPQNSLSRSAYSFTIVPQLLVIKHDGSEQPRDAEFFDTLEHLLRQNCSDAPARNLDEGQEMSLNVATMFTDCHNTKTGVGVGRSPAVSNKVNTPIPLSQEGALITCHALSYPHEVLPHCPFAREKPEYWR